MTCDLKISGAEQQQYSNERETAVLLFFFLSFFVIFIELSEVWTSHFKDSRIAFYSFKDMLFILHIVLSEQTFRTGFIQIYWPIMASWIIGRPSYRILNSCISIPFRNKVELGIFSPCTCFEINEIHRPEIKRYYNVQLTKENFYSINMSFSITYMLIDHNHFMKPVNSWKLSIWKLKLDIKIHFSFTIFTLQ